MRRVFFLFSGLYDHAAAHVPGGRGFLISGGVTASGSFYSALWHFDADVSEWSLKAASGDGISQHSLTLAGDGFVYLFGGFTSEKISSDMYRIHAEDLEAWEQVPLRGAVRARDLKITGHSAVFHADSNSLLVYGGIQTDVARFSRMNKHIFMFNLDSLTWSRLEGDGGGGGASLPSPRAFHSADIIGDLMVIFGGYVHKHNKVEECYDRKVYFYHLRCNVWMSEEVIPTANLNFPVCLLYTSDAADE